VLFAVALFPGDHYTYKKDRVLQGQEEKGMARNKTAQGGISLRRKVTAWLAAILLVTMLSTGRSVDGTLL
jgi:hypothetical protein